MINSMIQIRQWMSWKSLTVNMAERSRNTIDTRTQGIAQCGTSQKPHRNDNSSTQCNRNFTSGRMQLALAPITITTALTVISTNQQSLSQRYLFRSGKKTDSGKRLSLLMQTKSLHMIIYDNMEPSDADESVSRFSTVFILEGQTCVLHHQTIVGVMRRCPAWLLAVMLVAVLLSAVSLI